jgi:hypothetical protein
MTARELYQAGRKRKNIKKVKNRARKVAALKNE